MLFAYLVCVCVCVNTLISLFVIFQAFGQSFLQPDIDVFRQNLEALQSLNQSWKLYSKVSDIPDFWLFH